MSRTCPTSALLCVPLLAAGCSGLVALEQPSREQRCSPEHPCPALHVCEGGICIATDACSPAFPEGRYCRDSLVCDCHMCVHAGSPVCCTCPSGQGCSEEGCVPIDSDTQCSIFHPRGVCAVGDLCVGGHCVPVDEQTRCEPRRPNGLCGPGFVCDGGYCVAVEAESCDEGVAGGRCPAGEQCVDEPQPHCVTAECGESGAARFGVCPPGQVCVDATCVCIPCGQSHLDGCCAEPSTFCSNAGTCITEGSCADNGDCLAGEVCSCPGTDDAGQSTGECLPAETCRCDTECGDFRACDTSREPGQCRRRCNCDAGQPCPDAAFCAGVDWCSLEGETCTAGGACLPAGTCNEDADCEAPLPKCSQALTECVPAGHQNDCVDAAGCRPCIGADDCLVDADCGGDSTLVCLDGACLPRGECRADDHCPPGHVCNQEHACEVGDPCTANRVTGPLRQDCAAEDRVDAAGDLLASCCPAGEECCASGERCSDLSPVDEIQRTCIADGRCLGDSDCLTPFFVCDLATFACVPAAPCDGDCPEGQKCSLAGACIPVQQCADDADCPDGEACNAEFACERRPSCGSESLPAVGRIKPNMLILLDRSGSMELCEGLEFDHAAGVGGCCGSFEDELECTRALTSRWENALEAIAQITERHAATIRFGLSTYPRQWCGARPCASQCNYCTCETWTCTDESGECATTRTEATCSIHRSQAQCEQGLDVCLWDAAAGACVGEAAECHQNFDSGAVDVPVADGTRDAILASLEATYPGGGTPTGPTLRRIHAEPDAAGLADAVRDNFVILVTDGAANGDYDSVPGCGNVNYACKVNAALDGLRALARPITTYVVGFGFTEVNAGLNCHAAHGGEALSGGDAPCSQLTARPPCAAAGCVWIEADGECLGCAGADNETACDTGRCVWDGAQQRCLSWCAAQQDDEACTGGGCIWDAGAAACVGCSALESESECKAARCFWDGSACVGVTVENCGEMTSAAYFEADDAVTLGHGLDAIIGQVASCDFDLSAAPPDGRRIFVYFLDPVTLTEQRLARDPSHADNWDYYPPPSGVPGGGTVKFEGGACERIMRGEVAPLVLFGCCVGEAC